jgi:hypothetical protein
MSYPFIIQGNNVTVVIGNKPHTISKTHITYQKVIDAIKAGDWETVKNIIDPKKVVLDFGQGRVSVKGETLYWDGEVFNGALAKRMVEMLTEGFTIEPLVKFMENLLENPSKRSVDELYGFLEKNNLPITPDGHFLAYKKVREDYKDVHSGTMDNSPGQVVTMPRNKVDDDKDRTCSTGLHFCSEGYLKHFGGARTVIVKINPRDVVSIPSDYDNTKGRACQYEVIGEVGVNPEDEQEFTKPVQENANNNSYFVKPKQPDRVTKTGSTEFYKGYTDGFEDKEWDDLLGHSDSYFDGYTKGEVDRDFGDAPRYQYVPLRNVVAHNTVPKNVPWPFARGSKP